MIGRYYDGTNRKSMRTIENCVADRLKELDDVERNKELKEVERNWHKSVYVEV